MNEKLLKLFIVIMNSIKGSKTVTNKTTPLNNVTLDMSDNDMLTIQKMVFVYNALLKGWTVRKMEGDKFEFTRDLESEKQQVNLEDYLRRFIIYNLNIENIPGQNNGSLSPKK